LRFQTPMLFSIGFVSLFITGGLSGPLLAQPVLDSYLHNTYFVVAHFHLIMGMASLFAVFAATYFWAPLMLGRRLSEPLGKIHFWFTFIGAYATFIPMHLLGMAGHPRQYAQLTEVHYLQPLLPLQRFITWAALLTTAGQLIFLWNLFAALFREKESEANPWQSTTLEWIPLAESGQVQRGPYEFIPGAASDFDPQADPA